MRNDPRSKFFFSSVSYAADVIYRYRLAKSAIAGENELPNNHEIRQEWFKLIFRAILSIVIIVTGLWLILSGKESKIGSALIGTILGYWLR